MTELYEVTQEPTAAPVADVIGFNLGDLIVDEDVSKKGVWVDFYQGSKLLVASTSSGAYKAKLAKLARANKLILDDSNPDNFEAIQKITCEALATTVLLDWKGIHWPNADGTVQHNVRYSPALGMQALLKVDKLRDFVAEEAARAQNFKKETITEAKKP
jgi:hypothetical protein